MASDEVHHGIQFANRYALELRKAISTPPRL
jgi:hypothetical protein